MHATIRSYHGVDQTRTAELKTKVNESLVPKLEELPGFKGYFFVDAGNGTFASLGLFETPEQSEASTTLARSWVRDEKLQDVVPNEPEIMSGKIIARSSERVLVA